MLVFRVTVFILPEKKSVGVDDSLGTKQSNKISVTLLILHYHVVFLFFEHKQVHQFHFF